MNFEKQLVPYRILSLITISYILEWLRKFTNSLPLNTIQDGAKSPNLWPVIFPFADQITTSCFPKLILETLLSIYKVNFVLINKGRCANRILLTKRINKFVLKVQTTHQKLFYVQTWMEQVTCN